MRSIHFSKVGWPLTRRTDSSICVTIVSCHGWGWVLSCHPPGSESTLLTRFPLLTALAEARGRGKSWILLLLLYPVRLLHQGQAEPGAARPIGEAPADRGPAETPASPARPGPGGRQPQWDLFCKRLPTKWAWWVPCGGLSLSLAPRHFITHARAHTHTDTHTRLRLSSSSLSPSVKHGSS